MARLISSPAVRRVLALIVGAAIVGATVVAVGGGSFLRGLASVSPLSVAAALVLAAIATAAATWRWTVVAHALGLRLAWPAAVAAYYRSQFLNTVLPGGVLGDVHRAYRHGGGTGATGLAARAVATERIAGQAVQLALTVVVLVALGVTAPVPGLAAAVAVGAGLGALALGVAALTPRGRRLAARELTVVRAVFSSPGRAIPVVAASVVVVACHAATFVVACLATGVAASPRDLVVLALVVLSAASLPVSVGGWGPREAASASAFALLGLGASTGLAASVAFGVLAMIAVAPGAVVLIADRIPALQRPRSPLPEELPA